MVMPMPSNVTSYLCIIAILFGSFFIKRSDLGRTSFCGARRCAAAREHLIKRCFYILNVLCNNLLQKVAVRKPLN